MRSLRARLLAYGLLVAAVTIAVLALVLARGTREEAQRFVLAETILRPTASPAADSLAAALERHLRAGGHLEDAATVIAPIIAAWGGGSRVLILDAERHLAATDQPTAAITVQPFSDGSLRVETHTDGTSQVEILRGPLTEIRRDGGTVAGFVLVLPTAAEPPVPGEERAQKLVGSLGRWLLLAAVCAAGVALGLGLLLARRLSAPIETLTRAAQRLRAGERGARVDAAAPGEVAELAQAFNALAADLERTETLRRQLVSDVSHELRTPLTRLRGQIEALRDGLLPFDRAAVESLYEEAVLLSRLIEDVQQLALGDSGSLTLRFEEVDVAGLVRQCATAAGPQARAAGVELEVDAENGLTLRGDRERLAQVLGNLISNALAHTPRGGHVRVQAGGAPGATVLTVSDDGAGIAPEHVPHVFERFYRTDEARARRDGGSGLGLAIVRQIAEAHGGTASIASSPGRGTAVRVLVPSRAADGAGGK